MAQISFPMQEASQHSDEGKPEPAGGNGETHGSFYVVDDLLRAMALEKDQVPLIAYPGSERGLTDFEHFTALDLDRLTNAGVKYLISRGLRPVTVQSTYINSSIRKPLLM